MDSISVVDLTLWTRIGVTDTERFAEQRITLSAKLFLDTKPAAKADDVSKTIDYQAVADDLKTLAGTPRKTLERLAEDAATMILKTYKPEGGVKIVVKKFVIPGTKTVEIAVFRK